MYRFPLPVLFIFFNDTATTEIYTLSLHDALPISMDGVTDAPCRTMHGLYGRPDVVLTEFTNVERSEEHTSELQSQSNLVCRLLLEKKKANMLETDAISAPADKPSASTSRSGVVRV